jgi:hypothetical protein
VGVIFAIAIFLYCYRVFSASGNIFVTLAASGVTTVVVYMVAVQILEAFVAALMSTSWVLIVLILVAFAAGAATGFLFARFRADGPIGPFRPF